MSLLSEFRAIDLEMLYYSLSLSYLYHSPKVLELSVDMYRKQHHLLCSAKTRDYEFFGWRVSTKAVEGVDCKAQKILGGFSAFGAPRHFSGESGGRIFLGKWEVEAN